MGTYSVNTSSLLEHINELKSAIQAYEIPSTSLVASLENMTGEVPKEMMIIGQKIQETQELMLELYRQTIAYLEGVYRDIVESDNNTASAVSGK